MRRRVIEESIRNKKLRRIFYNLRSLLWCSNREMESRVHPPCLIIAADLTHTHTHSYSLGS